MRFLFRLELFQVYVKVNQDMEAEKLAGSQETEDEARLFFKNLEEGSFDLSLFSSLILPRRTSSLS